jgi:two-component system, CitB family, sensor kinase
MVGTTALERQQMGFKDWSIARRLFAANFVFVLLLTVGVGGAAFLDAKSRSYAQAGQRMVTLASSIADNPLVAQAATHANPSATLEPYALRVTADAGADFITIMAPDRTRWTHPNPAQLGKPYIGTIAPALAGTTFTETTAGTLGPSVRAVAPVMDAGGKVVALVAAGVTVSNLDVALNAQLPSIAGFAVVMLLAGTLASWLLGRYLRRVTLGWGPEQLARLFVYYDSVLHSVQDGLVLVDGQGDLVMYNDQAAVLLGIPTRREQPGTPKLSELKLTPSLEQLLTSGRSAKEELHLTDSHLLVVSQQPAVELGPARKGRQRLIGSVATIVDHTQLQALDDELRSSKTLADALRAQTHEHANRIHTMVSLLELGRTEQALDFATADLAMTQQLADNVLNTVDEPVISALLMGKISQAAERGIELRVHVDGQAGAGTLNAHDAVTVLGNLIDNAMDAADAGTTPRWVEVSLSTTADGTVLEVSDSGPGLAAEAAERLFHKGYTTKGSDGYGRGIGLALVQQAVRRLGGTLSVHSTPGAVFTVTLPPLHHPDETHQEEAQHGH